MFNCSLFYLKSKNVIISVVISMEVDQKLIGIRIMQRRKRLGLSQEKLAEQVGLSKNHISNIECGKSMPTTRFIMQICSILGETPDYYLIGKITEETEKFSELAKRLPNEHQRILCQILEIYLDQISH